LSEMVRVAMEWPKEVKETVREKVGPRGLTEFVLDAVHDRLNGSALDSKEEIREARDVAQKLADLVMSDSVDKSLTLTSMHRPRWLDTNSWPVPEVEPEPEPVAPEPDPVLPEKPTTEDRLGHQPDDFFKKVMRAGKLNDGEIDYVRDHLKPASDLEAQEAIEVMDEVVAIGEEAQLALDPVAVFGKHAEDLCPSCGEPRVDGECWTCD